jgi:rRNA-processing protein FCF1
MIIKRYPFTGEHSQSRAEATLKQIADEIVARSAPRLEPAPGHSADMDPNTALSDEERRERDERNWRLGGEEREGKLVPDPADGGVPSESIAHDTTDALHAAPCTLHQSACHQAAASGTGQALHESQILPATSASPSSMAPDMEMAHWLTDEAIRAVSARYDAEESGITPLADIDGDQTVKLTLNEIPYVLARNDSALKRRITEDPIEVLSAGRNTPGDVKKIISAFPNITALHIVDCDESVFISLNGWIGSGAGGLSRLPRIYGHKINAMELPNEWDGRFDVVIDTNLLDYSHMSVSQIRRIDLEFERVLKVGGLRCSESSIYPDRCYELTYDNASRMKSLRMDDSGRPTLFWVKTNLSVEAQSALIAESVKRASENAMSSYKEGLRESPDIVIAVETEYLGYQDRDVAADLEAIIGAIRHMVRRIQRHTGIAPNVEILYGGKDDILRGVTRARSSGVPYRNMAFIGQMRILKVAEFDEARRGGAFFACLNPAFTHMGLFQLPEMAGIAIDLAFGRMTLSEIERLHPDIAIVPQIDPARPGETVFKLTPILQYDSSVFYSQRRRFVEHIANQA